MSDKERRQYKRIKVEKIGADYRLVDPNFWAQSRAQGKNSLQDISLSGASFNTGDILPEDSVLDLNLKLGSLINIDGICGRIVRVRKLTSENFEIGVVFSWWEREEDKQNLVKFMEQTGTKQ
ncbi:MAG: PilZ domain-containing protein [Candidatus Omnitrophota bacterium]